MKCKCYVTAGKTKHGGGVAASISVTCGREGEGEKRKKRKKKKKRVVFVAAVGRRVPERDVWKNDVLKYEKRETNESNKRGQLSFELRLRWKRLAGGGFKC